MSNYFEVLSAVNCSDHVEKKNGFTYLSWAFAVGELLKRHPDATWRVIEDEHGWPFWQTPCGYFVKVGATVNGIERTQVHPVLDHANRPLKEPNAFHINTSIQRALVKAIALHGLGLYIYAGEDLPEAEKEAQHQEIESTTADWIAKINDCTDKEALDFVSDEIKQSNLPKEVLMKVRAAWATQASLFRKAA